MSLLPILNLIRLIKRRQSTEFSEQLLMILKAMPRNGNAASTSFAWKLVLGTLRHLVRNPTAQQPPFCKDGHIEKLVCLGHLGIQILLPKLSYHVSNITVNKTSSPSNFFVFSVQIRYHEAETNCPYCDLSKFLIHIIW